MNELLKGFRGQITLVMSVVLGNIEIIQGLIIQLAETVNVVLSPGGAVASLMGIATAVKLMITDTLPRIKGKVK